MAAPAPDQDMEDATSSSESDDDVVEADLSAVLDNIADLEKAVRNCVHAEHV